MFSEHLDMTMYDKLLTLGGYYMKNKSPMTK